MLTPERTAAAAKLIETGEVVSMKYVNSIDETACSTTIDLSHN